MGGGRQERGARPFSPHHIKGDLPLLMLTLAPWLGWCLVRVSTVGLLFVPLLSRWGVTLQLLGGHYLHYCFRILLCRRWEISLSHLVTSSIIHLYQDRRLDIYFVLCVVTQCSIIYLAARPVLLLALWWFGVRSAWPQS